MRTACQSPTTQVQVPGNNEWETISDWQTIDQLLNDQCTKHFEQASQTPIVTEKIDDYIKHMILTTPRDNWKQSLLKLEPKWPLAKHLIPYPSIPSHVTAEDVTHFFKKWKEKTTTSPSGRHLGIYKVITHPVSSEEN